MDGVVDELVDALVFRGGDWHDGHAELFLEGVDVDGAAVGVDFVHHIEGDDHGDAELEELHGQIEVALDVGGVDDVDDAAWFFLEQELAGDDLFAGIWRHGIDAGQVGDEGVVVAADDAVFAVDGDAGEIADVLVGAGELVEEGGLAAVLVAGEGEGQCDAVVEGCFVFFVVIDAAFAEAGMRDVRCARCGFVGVQECWVDGFHLNVLGVGQSQCELVAMHGELHGVAEGRKFDELDIGAWDEAHVQKMLAQLIFAANGDDLDGFADLKLAQRSDFFFLHDILLRAFGRNVLPSLCDTAFIIPQNGRAPTVILRKHLFFAANSLRWHKKRRPLGTSVWYTKDMEHCHRSVDW